jgi:hypothetical protein
MATDASADEPMSQTVERLWQERGLPRALLADARKLHVPDTQLRRMLHWNATQERFELELHWAGQLLNGTIRSRQVTVADNDAFCELWANAPEEIGEFVVTAERGPNAFAQFELQERPVVNALFDGPTMVACVSFSNRITIVGGQRLSVRYGQAMRVHKDHRRHGYANWVRSLPWAVGLNMWTAVQYDYIRGRNMTMERWNRKNMPDVDSVPKREDDVPGTPVTVLQYPAKRASGSDERIRIARPDDVERCAAIINRTHAGRDLFRPYTAEFLADRLYPDYVPPGPPVPSRPYTFDDFYVLERAGQIVACAGAWDRGRDVRERWQHRETGAERLQSVVSLLDVGFAEGCEDAIAALIEHLIGLTAELGRDYLVAPLETLPVVARLLDGYAPVPETRYLQWRTESPSLAAPAHLDLAYW